MVARTHEGLIESISQMTAKNIIGNPQVNKYPWTQVYFLIHLEMILFFLKPRQEYLRNVSTTEASPK